MPPRRASSPMRACTRVCFICARPARRASGVVERSIRSRSDWRKDSNIGALEGVAGLVLTGGEAGDPARDGAKPHAELGDVHEGRDAFEIALVHAARARGLPTLAICRGVQILNVALGGSLVQDIPTEWAN